MRVSDEQILRRKTKMAYFSNKTFFYISINTGQIRMGFKAGTPEYLQKLAHLMRFSDKGLV